MYPVENPAQVSQMQDEQIREHLEYAERVVQSWPESKRSALGKLQFEVRPESIERGSDQQS